MNTRALQSMSHSTSKSLNPISEIQRPRRSDAHGLKLALTALICVFASQTFMVSAQAADWGYDSEFADDKEADPKFSDHKSNIKAPHGSDPIRDADDIDNGRQVEAPVEELEAAPGALNSSKTQPKTGSKPSAGAKAAKPGMGSKTTPNSKSSLKTPTKVAPSSNSDLDSDLDAGVGRSQNSNSESDANTERDPVYREGINPTPSTVPVDKQAKIINEWLNLFGLVSPIEGQQLPKGPDYTSQLTDEQKERFTVTLKKLLNSKEQAGYKQIDNYWSTLSRLLQDRDHRSNYRVLFRSLLSMRADSSDISAEEQGMLHEALGPKRIAEVGPPPLTEDAIEAYTDMTCFLYEQSHEGKTVDADDNRQLYGMIIRDKFKKAPTDSDRMAMNQFPLSWAKFRILYTDANPSEKVLLAERIASEQGTKGLNIRNAMLEEVLSSPVWRRFVVGSNKVMVTSNTGKAKPRTAGGVSGSATTATKSGAPRNSSSGTAGSASKRVDHTPPGMRPGIIGSSDDELPPDELDANALSLKSGGSRPKKSESKPAASTAKPKRPL